MITDKLLQLVTFGSIALCTALSAHADDVLTLKYASPYPLGHPSELIDRKFISELEKRTNQKIKIEYFPAEQLGKAKDMLSVCGRGIADICDIHVTYFAGQLPYTNMIVLPIWTTAVEGTAIYQWMLSNVPEIQAEFARYGVRTLYGSTTPSYNVATVAKPVRSLDDMKGLKLKTAGGLYDEIAKRYGIVPVSIAASDTYEAMQHGVVEGVIFNYPSIKTYHLNDLIHYITFGMRAGGYPGTVVINAKAWNRLSKADQDNLIAVSDDIAKGVGTDWDRDQDTVREQFTKQGIAVYELTAAQKKEWARKLDGLGDAYVAQLEKRGFKKAADVMQQYKGEAARVVADH
jgi:TRAP-type C4-dicarboxylate transport system substrate-binding protein